MDDLARQVAALRFRLRLQMLVVIGVLIVVVFAFGGADVVARVLVETDAWKVRTNNASSVLTDRITVTSGENNARVRFNATHLELAQQATSPTTPAAGALWYDSTANKLKFYNGTAWAESGGGGAIGGSVVENDAWRLEFTNNTAISLVGIGNGGGSININGTLYGFAANPGKGNGGLTIGSTYRVYAYWTGSAVDLEISPTQATREEYGVYAYKNLDPSRRFVGLCVAVTGQNFAPEMVRSAKNEKGYAYIKKHAPVTAVAPYTAGTGWIDLESNVQKDGLFFDGERVRAWCSAMTLTLPWNQVKTCRLGVSFGGAAVEDSEASGQSVAGAYWANASAGLRSEGYVTVTGAGVKNVRALHKSVSGQAAQWYIGDGFPASVGFEVVR